MSNSVLYVVNNELIFKAYDESAKLSGAEECMNSRAFPQEIYIFRQFLQFLTTTICAI